jgi:hypothetical protein
LALSAPWSGDAKPKPIKPSIKATFVFITTPPSFSLLKIQITWNIFLFFFTPICQSFSICWHR